MEKQPSPKYDTGWAKPATDQKPVPGGVLQDIIQFLKCPREDCRGTGGYHYPAPEGVEVFECFHCKRPFTLDGDGT